MTVDPFAQLRRALIRGVSRRGLLAALPVGLAFDEIEAKKNGKRKRKRKNKRRKQRQNRQQPTPPPGGPITRADATCGGSTNTALAIGDGNARLAQTFTAIASGPLVSAELLIEKIEDSVGDYILRLSPIDGAGFPTNDVLAETSVGNASVPAGVSTIAFAFATPFSAVAGTQYALVLTRPGSNNLKWEGHTGDTCAGQSFVSLGQAAFFVAALNGTDLIYTTFVRS